MGQLTADREAIERPQAPLALLQGPGRAVALRWACIPARLASAPRRKASARRHSRVTPMNPTRTARISDAARPETTGRRRQRRQSLPSGPAWPGQHRLAPQPSPQVGREVGGRRVATTRLLGHRLQADRLEVAGDRDRPDRRGGRGSSSRIRASSIATGARERPRAGQQLVEDHAQAVDVGPRVDRLLAAVGLLRRHVGRRADQPGRRRSASPRRRRSWPARSRSGRRDRRRRSGRSTA